MNHQIAIDTTSDEFANASRQMRDTRSRLLLAEYRQEIYSQCDRLFIVLMLLQWIGGVIVALVVSPNTWVGEISSIHIHVWAAILFGGATSIAPIAMAVFYPGSTATRHVIAVAQASWSALLIHLCGGRIETHFHIFGSLAFLAFYRDWRVLLTASVVITADHILRGVLWPQSIYGVVIESNYRWIEHAFWVVFEDAFLMIACIRGQREVEEICQRRADLEIANSEIEERVATRTRELQIKTDEAEQLALVAKYTDNAVVITDEQGHIKWVNEGFSGITGYTFEEAIGMSPGKLLQGPDSSQETVHLMREAIARRQGFDVEIINYHKNGTPYWLAIEVRPIVDDAGNVVKFIAIESDITARKVAQAERDNLQSELVVASRQAGMAEVATGVLHNVGNVLNSVNVSANIAVERLKASRVSTLAKASAVILEQADLATFLTSDPRGKAFPRLLQELSTHFTAERDVQLDELRSLVENIDHIKEIVGMQQAFAKVCATTEYVDLVQLFEDALKIDDAAFTRHKVKVVRQFCELQPILTEKHNVMQIILNLVKNAKQSVNASDRDDKLITLSITADQSSVGIQVRDNGVGIEAGNLSKVFSHGFTTKSDGHGFGLHSCALAAQQLGGSLSVHSDGIGCGALFTLRLPLEKESLCKV